MNCMGRKLLYGVGINDADYVNQRFECFGRKNGKKLNKKIWTCPYYEVWRGMLERCYNPKKQARQPTYIGCSVCEEWLTFSNFKMWMEKQHWEDNCLDKDLLIKGNRVYSSETCVFVSNLTNCFISEQPKNRGEWPIGVYWKKQNKRFVAQCSNPFTSKREHLGYYDDPIEAHKAWLKRKRELAVLVAEQQNDPRVVKALIERYENYPH